MVHLESVSKCVSILVVVVYVGLVGEPRDVPPQLLNIILPMTDIQGIHMILHYTIPKYMKALYPWYGVCGHGNYCYR